MDLNDLRRRVITAILLAPAAIALILYAPSEALALVAAAVWAVGALEWAPLSGCRDPLRPWMLALVLCLALAALWLCAPLDPRIGAGVLAAGLLWWTFATLWVARRWALNRGVKLAAGALTLIPAWLAVVGLHQQPGGPELLLLLFFIIWGADVGAYFTGHRFGRRKLAPEVSPGKTWEGAWGGFALGALIAVAGARLLGLDPTRMFWLGLLTVAVSIVGDLTESLLKRQAGVKDSGTLLPGHGGVLDRLDSLFSAAPVFLAAWLATGGAW